MTGRGIGRALLGSGLLAVTLLGGAGGYGLGLLTTEQQASAGITAAPLAPSTSATVTTPPPKKLIPDDSEPLRAEDLRYKTRDFTVSSELESRVKVRVPGNWDPALQDPPKEMRFNEPGRKRLIRVQAGFTIERPAEESMNLRIEVLKALPADKLVTIKSHQVDPVSQDATLVYTYAEKLSLRHVITRWVANADGLCHLEIAVSGLPQDKAALQEIVDRAAESATRSDSPLN